MWTSSRTPTQRERSKEKRERTAAQRIASNFKITEFSPARSPRTKKKSSVRNSHKILASGTQPGRVPVFTVRAKVKRDKLEGIDQMVRKVERSVMKHDTEIYLESDDSEKEEEAEEGI